MIETEKATDHFDLPHTFIKASSELECVCGRVWGDRLHDAAPITEQAAHTAPLQTEKGT